MKKVVGLLAVTALALSACAPSTTSDGGNDDSVNVTFLGTSDIHGRYMPWDYSLDEENTSGSLAQIATAVKEVRESEDNVVLVDAGDFIQDNSSELFQDMNPHPGVSVMNDLNYDVWAIGNHEFDYGMEKLDKITEQFKGAVLGGNLYTDAGEQYWPATTVIERSGIKIGVVGLTTPMVYEFKQETDTFDGLKFQDTIEEAQKAIDSLGDVDAVVGVFHMGAENENNIPDTGAADIVEKVPGFDVVFAGHMHKEENEKINDTLVIEPGKYAQFVSRVDLSFTKDGDRWKLTNTTGENIPIKDYASDPKAEELLAGGHKIARDDANIVVGKLEGMPFTPGNKIEAIPQHQIEETPLTVFINEVMMHYSNGADVVVHSIDNDHAGLAIGDIKKKDLATNYRYAGGEVTVYEMTGQDLKDYMEWSAEFFNQSRDGDVTISFDKDRRNSKYSTHDIFAGVTYEYDISRPAGERVTNLNWPDGNPVSMGDKVKVGMNSYRLNQLISDDGPLAGRDIKKIYSTQQESAFGEVEGRIRNLAARYLQEIGGTYTGHLNGTSKIVGVPETPQYVVDLVNAEVISTGEAENGRSNVESVNVNDPVTSEMVTEVAKRANVDPAQIGEVKTTGDLYMKVAELMK